MSHRWLDPNDPDVAAQRSDGRFRLLPRNRYLGWTPYAWLMYLPPLFLEPFVTHRPVWQTALTLLGTLAFLASYFRGYWVSGRALVAVAAFEVVLGAALAPINTGSSVLFVYAAAFVANLDRPRDALRGIGAVSLAGLATSAAFHMPAYYWIVSTALPWLIGGVNLHFSQVGRANRRLRLAQDEIAHLAAVAERERIARDLHDVLGHTLSLITLKAELAGKLVERDPTRAAREIAEVEHVSRDALQQVRETIRGYRTSLAEELPRARALLTAAAIAPEVDAAAVPDDLPRALDEALALAVRESVTNVVRHSGARRCGIRVRVEGHELRLDVVDDGRRTHGAPPEGSGLRGMRERVEALGGTVARRHDRGTQLSVVVPTATSA